MNNLHISLTDFRNESRVLKEVNTLVDKKVFDKVFIAALHEKNLNECYSYSEKIKLNRFLLTTRKLPKNFVVQILKYLEFCVRLLFYYRRMNIKVVNIHSLGLLPLGLIFKKIYNAELVYDTHELETERNGLKGFRKKINKLVEKRLINNVDMTLVVSESIADWYANEYGIQRPSVILNAPTHRELKANNHLREQLDIRENQIILLYQGGLVTGRGIQMILDAFKVRENDDLVAVFMGYGSLEAEIKAAGELHNNIFFFPAVPPQVVLEYTASADVGISLIENSCLSYYYCMPNKLFEYAMAGLPVLVSNMKDMSELVIQNDMGSVITDFSNIGINKALDSFLQNDLIQMKANAYRVACENAWEVQEKKMLIAYKYMFKKSEKNNVHS